MPDAETMRALIERVEQATGADRRLDAEIGRGLGWEVWSYDDNDHIHAQIRSGCFQGAPSEHPDYVEGGGHVTWRYLIEGKPTVYGELPKWTASLDAAASLASDWLVASLGDMVADGLPGAVLLISTDPVKHVTGIGYGTRESGCLARALTAAALRARLAGENNDAS